MRPVAVIAIALLAAVAVVAALAGCTPSTVQRPPAPSVAPQLANASVLLVASGSAGTFAPLPDKPGSFSLTLAGVPATMTWFTDRPAREAGTISVADALAQLYADTSTGAPNAAIQVEAADPGNDTIIAELTGPAYDATTATLAFSARLLGQPTNGLEAYVDRADAGLPESFGNVSLFIDNLFDYNYCSFQVFNGGLSPLALTYSDTDSESSWDNDPPANIDVDTWATFDAKSEWGQGCFASVSYTAQTMLGPREAAMAISDPVAIEDNKADITCPSDAVQCSASVNPTGNVATGQFIVSLDEGAPD